MYQRGPQSFKLFMNGYGDFIILQFNDRRQRSKYPLFFLADGVSVTLKPPIFDLFRLNLRLLSINPATGKAKPSISGKCLGAYSSWYMLENPIWECWCERACQTPQVDGISSRTTYTALIVIDDPVKFKTLFSWNGKAQARRRKPWIDGGVGF